MSNVWIIASSSTKLTIASTLIRSDSGLQLPSPSDGYAFLRNGNGCHGEPVF